MEIRLSLKRLSHFCEQLATMLRAGIPLRQALTTAQRQSRGGIRDLCQRLGDSIEDGSTFAEALEREGRRFPVLMRRMVLVGEQVGRLDQVLERMAEYYAFLRQVRLQLISRIAWPLFEYWFAVLLFTGVAWLLGSLKIPGLPSFIAGASAWKVFMVGAAIFFTPIALYYLLTRLLGGRAVVHEIMMATPGVRTIMRDMALGRFAWCMEMSTDAGVSIYDAIRWSAEATGNHVFIRHAKRIVEDLRRGVPLPDAFSRSRLFPPDFMEFIETGSTSGSLSEMFGHLARIYFDRSAAGLKIVAFALFVVIMLGVMFVLAYIVVSFWLAHFREIGATLGG